MKSSGLKKRAPLQSVLTFDYLNAYAQGRLFTHTNAGHGFGQIASERWSAHRVEFRDRKLKEKNTWKGYESRMEKEKLKGKQIGITE